MRIALENEKECAFNKAKFEPSHVIISFLVFISFFAFLRHDMTQTKITG